MSSVLGAGPLPALTARNAWLFEPGAETFRKLAGDLRDARVERRAGEIDVISDYARLKLNEKTFAPLGEIIQTDDAEFEFRETAAERVPEASSPLAPPERLADPVAPRHAPSAMVVKEAAGPTAEELEGAELSARLTLHQLNADLGEEIRVRRVGNDVEVVGVADSRARKDQIAGSASRFGRMSG